MNCYDCGTEGKMQDAVAVCRSCGRATCMAHGMMQRVPQYRQSEGGIGGPVVRLGANRPCWLCRECEAAGVTAHCKEVAI
jgi:hypothetical protein